MDSPTNKNKLVPGQESLNYPKYKIGTVAWLIAVSCWLQYPHIPLPWFPIVHGSHWFRIVTTAHNA